MSPGLDFLSEVMGPVFVLLWVWVALLGQQGDSEVPWGYGACLKVQGVKQARETKMPASGLRRPTKGSRSVRPTRGSGRPAKR